MCAERREHLVYRSDFTAPWAEGTKGNLQCFHRNGYIHMAAKPPTGHMKCLGIPINDFKVTVDAEFVDNGNTDLICGIVFRNNGNEKYYEFCVNWDGHYAIWFFGDNKWDSIVPYSASEFINRRTAMNSLMVEMVGQKMTVAANGHVLASATDNRLSRGVVGLYVSAEKEYSEARFRDFRLYSIEYVFGEVIAIEKISTVETAKDVEKEDLIMPAPIVESGIHKETQRPASTQRPSDLHAYLEGILKDSGMTGLNKEQREEMIEELASRLNVFIISEIIDHLPEKYLEEFTKMHEQNRPQAEINKFLEEHMPNARQVFADIFVKFRALLVGKGGS